MTFLASRTIAVGARESQIVATMGFELTRLATTADECAATVRAGRTVSGFGLPIGGLTLKCEIVEHACA